MTYTTNNNQRIEINLDNLADFNFLKTEYDQCLQCVSINEDKGNDGRAKQWLKKSNAIEMAVLNHTGEFRW